MQKVDRVLNLEQVQQIGTDMLRVLDAICTKNHLRYYLVCGSVLGAVRHKGPIPWDCDVDITVPWPELDSFCRIVQEELKDTEYRICLPGDTSDSDNIVPFVRIAPKGMSPRSVHIDVFPQIGITDNPKEQLCFTRKVSRIQNWYYYKRLAYTETTHSYTAKGKWWKSLVKKTLLRLATCWVNAEECLEKCKRLFASYAYQDATFVTNPCGHYGAKNIVPKAYFGTPKRIPYLDMLLPVPEKTEEYLTHYYGNYREYPPKTEIDRMMCFAVKVETPVDK